MSLEIVRSEYFAAELKKLAKRYKSIADDLEGFVSSLRENPLQGDEIAPNIRKIRMAIKSKGKGKSGGARVITYNVLVAQDEGNIYLLLIYDKSETSNIKINVVKEIIASL